jgi:hypothetical protein
MSVKDNEPAAGKGAIEVENTKEPTALRFEVVTTPQQWLVASAIRSICFLEEHGASVDWVFDGNDYMASHVVIYDGDKAYRSISVLKAFGAFGFEHCARKGYTRIITHAGAKYARLWRIVLGFRLVNKEPAYFEGHEPYYELWKDLEPHPQAISLESSAALLYRVEGHWDEPGPDER